MSKYRQLKESSALYGGNAAFLEQIYQFAPGGEWGELFAQMRPGDDPDHHSITHALAERAMFPHLTAETAADGESGERQRRADRMVTQYRAQGARYAAINPLYDNSGGDELHPQQYGFSPQQMEQMVQTDIEGMPMATVAQLADKLRQTYCGTVALEFMHINSHERRNWLRRKFEGRRPQTPAAEKARLLERVIAAETLERFLHAKYPGQKRFSLEGGDTLIPVLDSLLRAAIDSGIAESVIGMAHRGRLNVLINTLGKQPGDLFLEFEGRQDITGASGDVKYHMGFSSTIKSGGGEMHLALAFNPSHLEIVNPVVEGSVRARQDRRGDGERRRVLPVIIHGDAAFAGQGVVMECFNFSQARGYKTGGTVHLVVNNQIGFTTSSPDDARSTFFCTDAAKMVEAPIFHVHCDDIEGAAYAVRSALEYRQLFGGDVVVDLVCFRRHGHNEQDEPLMTQPLMYQKIAKRPGSAEVYGRQLVGEGIIDESGIAAITADLRKKLENKQPVNDDAVPAKSSAFVDWRKFKSAGELTWDWQDNNAPDEKALAALGGKLSQLPDAFTPHSQLKRIVAMRREMAIGKRPLDWGMAENLAYATILAEGKNVRLSGQDCGRGTFSHRHAVWHDQKRDKRDGGNYVPLRNIADKQGDFLVIDSILSEEAVLGFEYGYSTTEPGRLVIWEAQFGDFANGAQVVIDQFIASGEVKWGRMCGLVLLLPHGYEGQGPEHSSARPERYLQLCAEYNLQVCVPSTPAQMYHLLRRQMNRPIRMPLIVITPKSLLRHPQATASLAQLAAGKFEPVIGETDDDIAKVKRVVFCAGKIYYELREERRQRKQTNVAILRIEQLYPFPHDYVREQIAQYAGATQIVWCQEEPGNQGAWHRIQHYLRRHLRPKQILTYALRPSSAAPATGRADIHKKQQAEVINAALDIKSIV
ncbi:MAG: 2-oxoglutarate dehydrogenase E1 component [Gammaproteobacteria bacterium]